MKALLLAPLIFALAGCGSPIATAQSSYESSHTADQIVRDAAAAMRQAHTFRLQGNVNSDSGPVKLDLSVAGPRLVKGQGSQGSTSFELILAQKKLFLRGHEFFAQNLARSPNTGNPILDALVNSLKQGLLQRIGDNWVLVSNGSNSGGVRGLSGYEDLSNPSKLADCLLAYGKLTKKGTQTIATHPTIRIQSDAGGTGVGSAELSIGTAVPHYLYRLVSSGRVSTSASCLNSTSTAASATSSHGTDSGRIDFDQYNANIKVSPPPSYVDLTALAQLGASIH